MAARGGAQPPYRGPFVATALILLVCGSVESLGADMHDAHLVLAELVVPVLFDTGASMSLLSRVHADALTAGGAVEEFWKLPAPIDVATVAMGVQLRVQWAC